MGLAVKRHAMLDEYMSAGRAMSECCTQGI